MKITKKQLKNLIREAIEVQSFRHKPVVEMKGCMACDETKMMLCPKCKGVQGRKSCNDCEGAGEMTCTECGVV